MYKYRALVVRIESCFILFNNNLFHGIRAKKNLKPNFFFFFYYYNVFLDTQETWETRL